MLFHAHRTAPSLLALDRPTYEKPFGGCRLRGRFGSQSLHSVPSRYDTANVDRRNCDVKDKGTGVSELDHISMDVI